MINTFESKPEFIDSDSRVHRPFTWAYTVTPELMTRRHELFFSSVDLKGKRVLDLGCCCAATGAWVLDRGADYYVGVEAQELFFKSATDNLSKYYSQDRFSVVNQDIETYLNNNADQFDIVVMFGVLHCLFDYYKVIKQLTQISQHMIIECFHPYNGFRDLYPNLQDHQYYELWKNLSLVQIAAQTGTAGEKRGSWVFDGTRISMVAFQNILGYLGWQINTNVNQIAIDSIPEIYSLNTPSYCPRYLISACPGQKTVFEFIDTYKDPSKSNYEYKNW